MDERDLHPEQALPGALVDQLGAFGLKLVDCRPDVVDLERDVVHAGPPVGEELPDRRVVAERGEQLDTAGADTQRGGLDTLVAHRLAVLEVRTEQALVGGDGSVEIVDGHAQVMNPVRLHAAAMLPGHSDATTRTVPTVSAERSSGSTSASRTSSSSFWSVSFSSSAFAIRSSRPRCFCSRRIDSA